MPIVLALLAAVSTALFFVLRARNAANAAGELLDMANDVRLAARRFGFRRRADVHPVEAVEDSSIALAALGSAFIALDDTPTAEARDALDWSIVKNIGVDKAEAEELTLLGLWLVGECGGAEPALARLARKLYRLQGVEGFASVLTVLNDAVAKGSGALSERQSDALDDIKRAFHVS